MLGYTAPQHSMLRRIISTPHIACGGTRANPRGSIIGITTNGRNEHDHQQHAAFDNVIEHTMEATTTAGEHVRELAQIGVRKATEGL